MAEITVYLIMAATSRQESDTEEDIMKVVPAKYITTDCRRKMSVVLDGRCDLEDRDYRYFAERNGLLPEIWQWLDAQKIEGDTSSFCKVLKYLIDEHGNSFTVFHVYDTFVSWEVQPEKSCGKLGQILYYNNHHQSGKWSNEHLSSAHTEYSITVEHVEAAHDSNLKVSNPSPFGSKDLSMDTKGEKIYNSLSLVEEKSKPHMGSLSKTKMSIGLPLNIEQKKQMSHSAFQSHVTPACSLWPGRAYEQPNIKQPFQSYQYALCGNSIASMPICYHPASAITCYHGIEEQLHQFVYDPPSYRPPSLTQERVFSSGLPWDGIYHNTEVKTLNSNTEDSRHQSVSKTQRKQNSSQRLQSFQEAMKKPTQFRFLCKRSLKYGARFQTPSMVSLCPKEATETVLSCENHGMEVTDDAFLEKTPCSKDAAEHFVLIISGDTDQKAASCSQVQHFCQVLKDFLVPHVAIVPTMECPVFWLTDKQKKELILPNQTRAAFLKNCYKKAKKIVIAVSPNFVRYSDSNSSGNTPANEKWQPFIQWMFKEMYAEHVDERRKTHRLWPVLLTTMDTDRQHIPWFLSQVLYYYFPKKQGSEDVAELLQTEVRTHSSEE
ncbi:hypothetical protein C0Q70_04938 [Pomacea canaliculata]|uniref:SEFIR domain-containing protein n=1 Tax=Pomacea canaliculata TaxID=400727 RepID=A0A2T7PJU8_POMCA|nr:hypothetical protein C0Q70_04938 [Pomacea canaliculata]